MGNHVITFDRSLMPQILSSFGKELDGKGYIINSKTKARALSPDGEFIKANDLGGIAKGSEIYLKSDIISLIKYFEGQK